jgi:hypothetical protein
MLQSTSEISVVLRYKSPIVGWTIGSWKKIKPNSITYLGDTNVEKIRVNENFCYYYAYYIDENGSKWEWKDDKTWEYDGRLYDMRYIEPYIDYNNDYVITLRCS